MVKLDIVTCNVRGLAQYAKHRDLFHTFRSAKNDIMFLQETHSTKAVEKMIHTQWGCKIWFFHGVSNAHGVAIISLKKLDCTVHNVITDGDGIYIILYCTIQNCKMLLSNVYAPNIDDAQFMSTFFTDVSRFHPEFIIIGGDFNLVMDINLDKHGGNPMMHQNSQQVVKSYCQSLDLYDV